MKGIVCAEALVRQIVPKTIYGIYVQGCLKEKAVGHKLWTGQILLAGIYLQAPKNK